MSSEAVREKEYLYEQIAGKMARLIKGRTLRPGEKLPSVRKLSQQERVSISTVLQAYYWLESRGLIEAHPQSGFYVCLPTRSLPPEPEISSPRPDIAHVGIDELIAKVFDAVRDPEIVPLGAALPSPELFPNRKLVRLLSAVARRHPTLCNQYDVAPGNDKLRRQIARLSLTWGGGLPSAEIVVTCGCLKAINLCLRAVTEPGDVVAVESPTYFGVLQVLETLRLRALEIPSHPRHGISVEALDVATEQTSIRACLVIANGHNPLGSYMPEENKRKLVALLGDKGIPLIEDDIFGDLWFGKVRPKACKAFDKKGLVLLCSSFSKTLAPGYRIGWTAPGKFVEEVTRLKRAATVGTPAVLQLMIAEMLENGRYEYHLRGVTKSFDRCITDPCDDSGNQPILPRGNQGHQTPGRLSALGGTTSTGGFSRALWACHRRENQHSTRSYVFCQTRFPELLPAQCRSSLVGPNRASAHGFGKADQRAGKSLKNAPTPEPPSQMAGGQARRSRSGWPTAQAG